MKFKPQNLKFLLASIFLLLAVLLAGWRYSQQPKSVALTPVLSKETEYCLTCHADLPEISPSHPVETFGCVICHGGERLALDADLAHSTMRGGRNPSDLSVVEASCGGSNCHSRLPNHEGDLYGNQIQRVQTGLQATYAGAIAQVRYAFGAQPDPRAHMGAFAIQDTTLPTSTGITNLSIFNPKSETNPAIRSFGENCLYCHLSANPLPGPAYAHLVGCAACHTPTANTTLEQPIHQLTLAIPYTQCNTCHNRGNYNLVDMQFHPRQDQAVDRLRDYYQPIAQFTRCEWTLDCVDCHTRGEAMGDGDLHSSKKEVQYIQCRTCHGTLAKPPLTRTIISPNDLAVYLAFINPVVGDLQVGDTIVVTEKGEPVWNMRRVADGNFELYGKASGQRFTVPLALNSKCQQKEDEQAARYCHACHIVERNSLK